MTRQRWATAGWTLLFAVELAFLALFAWVVGIGPY